MRPPAACVVLLLAGTTAPTHAWAQLEATPEPAVNAPVAPLEPSWTVPTLHGLGLFATLRLTEAYLWPDPFAETRLSVIGAHYAEAFTRPPKFDANRRPFEWDGDPWAINVVGHALMGSELYTRARICGQGVLPSLLFTAAGAAVWDYGFEASGVRPSAVDLVYTPAAGLALGELRYWLWSESSRVDRPVWRQVLLGVFDPLGELERWAGTPC